MLRSPCVCFLAVPMAWIPSSFFICANAIHCSKVTLNHSSLITPFWTTPGFTAVTLLWAFTSMLALEHFTCLRLGLYLLTLEEFWAVSSTAMVWSSPGVLRSGCLLGWLERFTKYWCLDSIKTSYIRISRSRALHTGFQEHWVILMCSQCWEFALRYNWIESLF